MERGGVNSVKAKTLSVDLSGLPASSENTTWSWNSGTSTGTFAWSGTSWNSTQLFGSGNYSAYETLNIVTAAGTADHFRIIVKFTNGTGQLTIDPVSVGTQSFTLLDHMTSDDLAHIETIRLSGAGNVTGNITVTSIYLEGPDPSTRTVYALGSRITFAEALATSDPFVLVQDNKVLCGPLSPLDNSLTFKDVSEIDNYSWAVKFEEDATNAGSYFMELYNSLSESIGFVNGSVWSHTYLSGVNKETTKGELQDGALWTITETGIGTGKYTIKNLGVAEGSYNNKPGAGDGDRAAAGQGYLGITPNGYWANHVTMYNTSGEWEFYLLGSTELPANDHLYYGWSDLTIDGGASKDDEIHLVKDTRGYAPYWAESAKWVFGAPFDATNYHYLVFYAKRNLTQFGNEDAETGGTLFIKDNSGVTFRQDDYAKYGETNYPEHIGKIWMNRWNAQRATVLDLQWLANTDKFGDGSDCKVLDVSKITEIGVAGVFTIGGIYFTNTLPDYSSGDYKRSFDSFDKFGTVCLPYGAVCCGAQLYEITGKTAGGIIISEYEGIMEPGKPYLYKTLEAIKQDGGLNDEDNVYFFKAGYEVVGSPVSNNGLIGTFSSTSAPQGSNIYVLSGNKLYDTAGSTVTVGANKAWINVDAISTVASARPAMFLDFDEGETTGIKTVDSSHLKGNNYEYYNLSGLRVNKPSKGLYIVNGKKIIVK